MYEKPRQSHKYHSLLSLLIPVLLSSLLLIVFFHFVVPIVANASMKSPPPKTVDVIVIGDQVVNIITGDAFAVQKSMADYQKTHPEFDQIKAVKDMAIYALPQYVGFGVLEYPAVLKKRASALL